MKVKDAIAFLLTKNPDAEIIVSDGHMDECAPLTSFGEGYYSPNKEYYGTFLDEEGIEFLYSINGVVQQDQLDKDGVVPCLVIWPI